MQAASYAASSRGQRGTIEQLPDGRHLARYRAGGRGAKRPQRIFRTRREAERWLRDSLAELERRQADDLLSRHAATSCAVGAREFLASLDNAPPTRRRIAYELAAFTSVFGDRPVQSVEPYELEKWRLTLAEGWRADVFREVRRLFRTWQRWGWVSSDPTAGIVNKRRRRPEVKPLSWAALSMISDEIDLRYTHVPVLAAGTGLRPEEWLALERRDLDLEEGVLRVERVWSSGRLVELGADGSKTHRQRRRVPLEEIVIETLRALPPRLDTPLLVPPARKSRSGYLTLTSFRANFWQPALTAAGLPPARVYDMRHTYAATSIAAGVGLFDLSRFMGTSLAEIDRTYGHLVEDSEERNRQLLNAYRRKRAAR